MNAGDPMSFNPNGDNVVAGFVVFVIIQFTVGFFVTGMILMACSRRLGHVKRFNWMDCGNCGVESNDITEDEKEDSHVMVGIVGAPSFRTEDDVRPPSCTCCEFDDDDDDDLTDEPNWVGSQEIVRRDSWCSSVKYVYKRGPCVYYTSTFLLGISFVVIVTVLGVWVGRAIAVSSVSQCAPYGDTRIGFLGCVSNDDGSYVGGYTCSGCAGIGFLIFGIPLLGALMIGVIVFLFIKRCRRMYARMNRSIRTICCKPIKENICWKYLVMPIWYVAFTLIMIGLLYLYAVPFTNIVGQALFADFKCPEDSGVWQVCGRMRQDGLGFDSTYHFDPDGSLAPAGFLVFMIIQSTVGFLLLASILAINSRRKGYIKRCDYSDCCLSFIGGLYYLSDDNWTEVTEEQDYTCYGGLSRYRRGGQCMYYNFTWLFITSIIVSTIVIGTYGGRAIAVNQIAQCMPFHNTSIGLYGCVSDQDGSYVGGKGCTDCAGVGFGILGIPLLIMEVIMVGIYFFVKGWCRLCREAKDDIQIDNRRDVDEIDSSPVEADFDRSMIEL